jgi:hypothetical protein
LNVRARPVASDISVSSETSLPGSLVLSVLGPSDSALYMLAQLFGGCAPRSRIAADRHSLPARRARSRVQASAKVWMVRYIGGRHPLRCDLPAWCLQCLWTLVQTRRNAGPLHPRIALKSAGGFGIHPPALRGYAASPNLTVNRTRRHVPSCSRTSARRAGYLRR